MSVLLTDDFRLLLRLLGLQPDQHEHLIIERLLSEEEFVEKAKDTDFTSLIGLPAAAAYLTEIFGREVTATPYSQSRWTVEPMAKGDTLYVASFMTSRNQGEPGLREVREATKDYFRVYFDPMVVVGIAIPFADLPSDWFLGF
ncbi:hypothetical protein KSF_110500 [Reticulibacter mediterranei]|uniref:Uncharacterized protein n=1 Tax=Reticulibacter mediterranei TaxID=2778369 RepID=A0A8J3N726_9CHLR|nr:hypothetical protein [Reticulibacter mediterranei]GHP01003.1 hypothetical protein KSF_110500 [Reticulibacter mediterranei]